MVKHKVQNTVKEAIEEIFKEDIKKELSAEIMKKAGTLRISPTTETVEIEISVKVKKVRR